MLWLFKEKDYLVRRKRVSSYDVMEELFYSEKQVIGFKAV